MSTLSIPLFIAAVGIIFARSGWALALGALMLAACAVTVFAKAAVPPGRP